jgi:hypothetical protein
MRANGVRSLAVTCLSHFCSHEAVLDVTIYGDDVPVPAFGLAWSAAALVLMHGQIGRNARQSVYLEHVNREQAMADFEAR